ncbi:MAG: FliM/FliN family flagellar motor switch protein [Pseudomonadota bacterium]
MGDTENQTVLARITASARTERKAKAMTLQKALRVAVAKVADALMDMPAAVLSVSIQDISGEEVEATLDDAQLQLILDGPAGCIGAAMFAPVVVGAMIQQQTIGSVSPGPDPERAMTRTDAAICAPLLDMLFERLGPLLDEPDEAALMAGFQFGAKAQDARTLALALDASAYVAIRLTLDIARGARQGEVVLILPTLAARAEQPAETGGAADPDADSRGGDMAKLVMGLNADLHMVLCRINLPLSRLNGMKPGDTLDITPGAFPNVQITTATGRILGRGEVGHVDGVRAVKPLRAPLHAARPLRRASDKPLVDMPEVEVLTASGRRTTVPREVDVSAEELAEAMGALPPLVERRAPAASDAAADVPFPIEDDVKDTADLPDLNDLPDLEDVPDLSDLPELDDLPDLADLPDLEMQVAS